MVLLDARSQCLAEQAPVPKAAGSAAGLWLGRGGQS